MSQSDRVRKSRPVRQAVRMLGLCFVGAAAAYCVAQFVALGFDRYLIIDTGLQALLIIVAVIWLVGFAIVSAVRNTGYRRVLSILATPAVLVAGLIAFVLHFLWLPVEYNQVELADGRRYLLAQPAGTLTTDVSHLLLEPSDNLPFTWKQHDVTRLLTHSESGFPSLTVENPTLVVGPDERFLLIRAGEVWIDCLEIARDLAPCADTKDYLPETRDAWIRRSDLIVSLTGLPAAVGR